MNTEDHAEIHDKSIFSPVLIALLSVIAVCLTITCFQQIKFIDSGVGIVNEPTTISEIEAKSKTTKQNYNTLQDSEFSWNTIKRRPSYVSDIYHDTIGPLGLGSSIRSNYIDALNCERIESNVKQCESDRKISYKLKCNELQ